MEIELDIIEGQEPEEGIECEASTYDDLAHQLVTIEAGDDGDFRVHLAEDRYIALQKALASGLPDDKAAEYAPSLTELTDFAIAYEAQTASICDEMLTRAGA